MTDLRRTPLRRLLLLSALMGGASLVEDTATGNPVTFETDVAKPLVSLEVPFTPIQEGSGDPSPQNIRSILPWNGLSVFGGGKNLLNVVAENAYAYSTYTHYTISNGSLLVDGGVLVGFKVRCKPLTTYTFSIKSTKKTTDLHLRAYGFETEPTSFVTQNTRLNEKIYSYGSFTTEATDNWLLVGVYVAPNLGSEGLTISDIQLEAGSTATAYEPYEPITETDISFTSPVYGGTLDVVSGVLTVEWATKTFDGSSDEVWYFVQVGSTAFYRAYVNMPDARQPNNMAVFADSYKGVSFDNRSFSSKVCFMGNENETPVIFALITDLTTLESFKAYLAENPLTIAYKLATPQEITLTPAQITALVGDNTIWSDADGSMTAVYLKKA